MTKQRIHTYFKTMRFGSLIVCLALCGLSFATLYSVGLYGGLRMDGRFGNFRPLVAQVLATGLGLAGAVLLSALDYRRLAELKGPHVLCWGVVLLTLVPGVAYGPAGTGSNSWIAMPFGMSLQPTEFAKLSFLLTLALHLAKVRDTLNKPKTLLPVLLHLALPSGLIHLQGDDGTALVFLFAGLVMLLAAGLNRWVVAGCATILAATAPLLWQNFLSDYQRSRVLGLIDPAAHPDTMYQQVHGRAAVSGGGLFGRGLLQPQHSFVPRPENDFIFSYFAESCGFIGSLLLMALLGFLLFKTLRVAMRAQNRIGAYLCTGVFAILLFHTGINLAMNLMLFPVMGLPLPFFSAGGSAQLTFFCMLGLVLSVQRHRNLADLGGRLML